MIDYVLWLAVICRCIKIGTSGGTGIFSKSFKFRMRQRFTFGIK